MTAKVKAIPEIQIVIAVSKEAGKEDFYNLAQHLGRHAASVLGRGRRSQMTGLEAIANGTLKRTDVLDFIKNQIGRLKEWREPYRDDQPGPALGLGERLLQVLEQDLGARAARLCQELGSGEQTEEGRQLRRRLHLLLIRQFIRSMVAQYEASYLLMEDRQKLGIFTVPGR